MTTGVDYSSIRLLALRFGALPLDLRRELRPRLRAAGSLMQRTAQANASWSTRIPAAIRVTTTLASTTGGVGVRVDSTKAPHARAFEGIGSRSSTFRHPVFGNTGVWTEQQERPFLVPAVNANRTAVQALIATAVRDVSQKLI